MTRYYDAKGAPIDPRNLSKYKCREIIHLVDYNSEKGLGILERDGKQAALEYLLQWDKSPSMGRMMKRLTVPGHHYRIGQYIVYHDKYAPYIGLIEVLGQEQGAVP